MPPLTAVRAANVAFSFKQPPIALFVGGTSGIGQALSSALARYTDGNARILLCGRNRSAAEQTIRSYPKHVENPHSFVESDLFQMKNVENDIRSIEQNANLSDTEKMFSMQMSMNSWSAISNLRTNMLKSVADTLKSVARNIN